MMEKRENYCGKEIKDEDMKKEIGKAYGKYAQGFAPKPKYFANCLKAFLVGGGICTAAEWLGKWFQDMGLPENSSRTYVTVILVALAQLLTGFGVFDVIAKFAGAGVIVPITGFANSMVAPALEFKREGPVLGVGKNLFAVAGPVLVCGISAAVVVGIAAWLFG